MDMDTQQKDILHFYIHILRVIVLSRRNQRHPLNTYIITIIIFFVGSACPQRVFLCNGGCCNLTSNHLCLSTLKISQIIFIIIIIIKFELNPINRSTHVDDHRHTDRDTWIDVE